MDRHRAPLLVDLVEASELVRAGLEAMLPPHGVVLTSSDEGRRQGEPALTLYDVPGPSLSRGALDYLVERPHGGRLVLYCWEVRADAVGAALAAGAAGFLSKSLPSTTLVDALHRVAAGDTVVRGRGVTPGPEIAESQLTRRETQVLGLIASGMSNTEIARATSLSINSVKTYIRGAYQKIGARTRSQALLWALEHGCVSDRSLADPPVEARRSRPRVQQDQQV